MIDTFRRFFKLAFLFSAVITSWTSIILLSNTTFNLEIKEVINKMFINQKDFIFNVKDLSILLVKDANMRFSSNNQDNSNLNE